MSKIKLVGLELEGGWMDKDMGPASLFETPISATTGKDLGDMIHQDISVGNTGADPNFRMTSPHVGEIASPPLTLKDSLPWLKEHWPAEVNNSCGFHVHVSFKSVLDYSRLMEPEFWPFFLKMAEEWGKEMKFPEKHQFWPRLRGENRFCFAQFRPEEQVTQTTKPQDGQRRDIRRTHLNYCYGFPNEDGSPRGTLECRLFPMFKQVETAQKAVLWLVGTYEEFLKDSPRETRKTLRLTKEELLRPLPRRVPPPGERIPAGPGGRAGLTRAQLTLADAIADVERRVQQREQERGAAEVRHANNPIATFPPEDHTTEPMAWWNVPTGQVLFVGDPLIPPTPPRRRT